MQFSWDFLQNMLENGHSKLQTKFGVHITSNIFKIIQFKNHGIVPTPKPPNFESLPYPRCRCRFKIFSLKWRERMNLKVPGAILPIGCAILSTRAKTVWGLLQPPFGELGLPGAILPIGCAILSTRAKTVWGLLQPPFGELGLNFKT